MHRGHPRRPRVHRRRHRVLLRHRRPARRDRVSFGPAVRQGKADGLSCWASSRTATPSARRRRQPDRLPRIHKRALRSAKPPAQGGDEVAYLDAFLDARVRAMKQARPGSRRVHALVQEKGG
ncbi:chitosanase [Streptomyces sp.]|uniref:chitosanase n=1 Tax=Streptomyces sp. TaxID=1931 RepID=UPI002812756A|nr:chitosanase [Streptomyces sp.]